MLEKGSTIKVPNDYGKQFTLYIDVSTFDLRGIDIYDEKGKFESYTYKLKHINKKYTDNDFKIK